MNYRHAFHAGGFADVLKHAALVLVLRHLALKEAPFFVLDSHAGRGRYDLAADEARRTGEAAHGIVRILDDPAAPAPLRPYLDLVRAMQPDAGGARWYPGSPRIVRALLRGHDRLFAAELHPEDAQALAAEFARDRQVRTFALDGYNAVRAFLPPKERRGAVLIDPAFEVTDEFDRLAHALADGLRRWATATFLAWYPVKYAQAVEAFLARAAEVAAPRPAFAVELLLRKVDDARLAGCGLAVVNPPYTLAGHLEELLPYLAARLGEDEGAAGRLRWLTGEPAG